MARTSQVAGFVTRPGAARPVTIAARTENGGGTRVTGIKGASQAPVISGSARAVKTKGKG